nr:disease resistance protein TAO1-like [Oryza sativa Japonica Group]
MIIIDDLTFPYTTCFVQISQKDDRLVTLTMHDPVHDMARSVIDDELIVLDDTKENKCGQSTYRYVFITNYDKPSKEFSMILHGKIRALHLVGCSKTKLNDGAFSSAKCLRVLDLNHCSIQKLPDSIYQLKQLQYLHAPQVRDGVIPESISMLSKLNYLNLRESPKISKLPESIGKLEALTYLNLSGCSHLVEFPESFGELRNLEHLDLSGCSRLVELPETVGKLDALMYLNLSGSRIVELPESFRELKNLVHLDLSNCTHLTDVSEHLGSLNRLYRPRLYSRCLVAYPRRRKIQGAYLKFWVASPDCNI